MKSNTGCDNIIKSMEKYMEEALKEAEKAYSSGEVPIGCVIVKEGKIIGRGHNQTQTKKDPTAHAEMLAIRQAAGHLGGWRLLDTQLYVTCEPCSMCAGAIIWARIPKVIYGVRDPKGGAAGSVLSLFTESRLNHQPEVVEGVLAEPCGALLKEFFKDLRNQKSEDKLL